MLSDDGTPPTLQSLVNESVPEERPARPEPFTTTHLKTILHNSKLLLDLYRQGREDPESSPDLLPFEPKHPIDFYRRFASGEESRMIAEIEQMGPELHAFRIKHQDIELARLKREARRGLVEDSDEVVVPGNEGEGGVSEEQYVDLPEHKSSHSSHDEQALEHISREEGMDANLKSTLQDTTAGDFPSGSRDGEGERGVHGAFYTASERERMPKYQPFGPPSTGEHTCGEQCYFPFNFGTGRLEPENHCSAEQRDQLNTAIQGTAKGDPRFGTNFGFNHPVSWPQEWALLDIRLTVSVQEYLAALHFPDPEAVANDATASTGFAAALTEVPADSWPSPFELEVARLVSSPSIPRTEVHEAASTVTFPNETQQPYRQEKHETTVLFGNVPSDAVELDAAPSPSSSGSANTSHELDSNTAIVPTNRQEPRQQKPVGLQFGAFTPDAFFDDADPIPTAFVQQTFNKAAHSSQEGGETQVAAAPEYFNHSAAASSPAQRTMTAPETILPVASYDDDVHSHEAEDLYQSPDLKALYHDTDNTLAPFQVSVSQRPPSPDFYIPPGASRPAAGPFVPALPPTDHADHEHLKAAQAQWWAAQTALNSRLRNDKYTALNQLRESGVTLLDPLPQRYKTEALIGLGHHVRGGSQELGLEYGLGASGPLAADHNGDGDSNGQNSAGMGFLGYGSPVPAPTPMALLASPPRIPIEMMPPQVQNRIQTLAPRPQIVNRSSTVPLNATSFTSSPSPANVSNPDLNIPRAPRAMLRKAKTLNETADQDDRRRDGVLVLTMDHDEYLAQSRALIILRDTVREARAAMAVEGGWERREIKDEPWQQIFRQGRRSVLSASQEQGSLVRLQCWNCPHG
ncbi:uncharacterized protein AB675_2384 [Cyphellophora attinorum]|uniref:Uncharacterized protein n=1 Tax=Cyphellophora attinorum TaxID=1664694 RepID=A0A0N1HH67_9EURO|nr:uncharacterized protein AB675_2384 [Phialophora attinorum]KPI45253.1 hypothetical protein AB675_2384 [Phialophora attinorum]